MKKIGKFFLRILFVNRVFRNFIVWMQKILKRISYFWHPYGEVDLVFDTTKFKMFSKGDDNLVDAHFYDIHYHEIEDLRFFSHLAKKASVVFDIGANTGIYSILSEKKNSKVQIFAFEPYHINIERLKKNLELNDSKVIIIDKAIGDKITSVDFAVRDEDTINDASSANIEYSKMSYDGKLAWKTIQVPQVTIDSFCQEQKIEKVHLMKIDVEGYEEAVISGGSATFLKDKPVIQCEIVLDDKKKIFFDSFLKQFDFCAYLLMRDGILRIDQDMQINPGGRVNYLFAKKRTEKVFNSYANIDDLAAQFFD